LAVKKLKSNN